MGVPPKYALSLDNTCLILYIIDNDLIGAILSPRSSTSVLFMAGCSVVTLHHRYYTRGNYS